MNQFIKTKTTHCAQVCWTWLTKDNTIAGNAYKELKQAATALANKYQVKLDCSWNPVGPQLSFLGSDLSRVTAAATELAAVLQTMPDEIGPVVYHGEVSWGWTSRRINTPEYKAKTLAAIQERIQQLRETHGVSRGVPPDSANDCTFIGPNYAQVLAATSALAIYLQTLPGIFNIEMLCPDTLDDE